MTEQSKSDYIISEETQKKLEKVIREYSGKLTREDLLGTSDIDGLTLPRAQDTYIHLKQYEDPVADMIDAYRALKEMITIAEIDPSKFQKEIYWNSVGRIIGSPACIEDNKQIQPILQDLLGIVKTAKEIMEKIQN